MWPWGHVAVAYLVYSLWRRRTGARPEAPAVFLVAFGAVVPDLVDKPLAWTFGVLESARSLGHSWLVGAVVVVVLVVVVAPRTGRTPVVAFAVGYLSHPIADLPVGELLAGEVEFVNYLVWPARSVPPPETDVTLLAYLLAYEPGATDAVQLVLVGLAGYVWYRDGRPGWDRLTGPRRRSSG